MKYCLCTDTEQCVAGNTVNRSTDMVCKAGRPRIDDMRFFLKRKGWNRTLPDVWCKGVWALNTAEAFELEKK